MQKLGLKFGRFGVSSLYLAVACAALACGGSAESAPPPATPEAPPPAAEPPPATSTEAAAAPEAAAPKSVEVIFQSKSGSKLAGKATLSETP